MDSFQKILQTVGELENTFDGKAGLVQKFLQIIGELEDTFDFGELCFDADKLAWFIVVHPGKAPVQLVYRTENGTESDDTIREDLSSLIGFEINYQNRTYVILTRVITKEDLKDPETATVGELREIAKTFYPSAMPIPDWIAALMWVARRNYYITKFLLHKQGIELPDIQILSSIKQGEDDSSPFADWNSSCGRWNYMDGDGGGGRIEGCLPIWCYYLKE